MYIVSSPHRWGYTFTDGGKLGSPPASGAAAPLRSGDIPVCRVPGIPNSYKAELVGALLGSQFSADGQKIQLDCKGAIASAESTKLSMRQAAWVLKVRKSLQEKRP